MKTVIIRFRVSLLALSLLGACVPDVFAQGTAFTYQGQLSNGTNAVTGSYDLKFALFNANIGPGQVGNVLTNTATAVTNGLFTVTLDFGANFPGAGRWLEIGVRTNGSGAFTTLAPRQPLTPAPYAITASNAVTLIGSLAGDVTGTQAATVVGSVGGQTAANVASGASAANAASSANTPNTIVKRDGSGNFIAGTVTATTFVGSGANLINLNPISIVGTLAYVQLPSNILSNNASGVTLSGTFNGNGGGLTNLNASQLTTGTVPLAQLSGITSNQLNAATWQLATNLNGGTAALASNVVSGISITNAFITNSTFAGNGAGLTNLGASQLSSGTVPLAQLNGITSNQLNATTWQLATNLNGGTAALASNVVSGISITNAFITNSTFAGNGAGLTNLNASQLSSGTIALAQLPSVVVTNNNVTSVTLNGAFSGNGGALTNVNAATLGGLGAGSFWKVAGNGGTTAGVNFVGTTDNQPLELKVNGQRALRLEPTSTPNFIAGSSANYASNAVGVSIGGGTGNGVYQFFNAPDFTTIGGGMANVIESGPYATIGGGGGNTMGFDFYGSGAASYCTIGGGATNTIHGNGYSTIAGGNQNFIVGANSALSTGATIGGGQSNTIQAGTCTIGGGAENWGFSLGATVAGGQKNHVYGDDLIGDSAYASIGGGSENTISQLANHAAIGGGQSNEVFYFAYAATIAGGFANQIKPPNFPGGYGAIGGGQSNLVTAPYATIPGGLQAAANNYGQMAYASGQFTNAGDAQTSVYVCRGTTADATLTELFLDGASKRMIIPNNSTWAFDVLVTARASNGNSAAYQIRGAIKNNSGTTSIVGSPTFTLLAEDVASWDASAVADNANDALVVKVTGAAATSIRWVATVRTSEVTF